MIMMKKIVLSLIISCGAITAVAAPNVKKLSETITDDYIVAPTSFETSYEDLVNKWYENTYLEPAPEIDPKTIVNPTDEIYIERLQYLQNEGGFVIEMPYNSVVKKYIEMYTSKRSKLVEKILGLWPYYEPIFEAAFIKEGIPTELKYLSIIESALNPNAVSPAAAAGLWQFIPSTGRGMGLEINSLVDERRDTYKATQKAAEFLHQLYNTYGDWSLAIAAYNCGPGNVNKAMRRSGGKDFWEIYNYLPKETRGYVPAFIAAAYSMNFHNEHGIGASIAKKPLLTDTVKVYKRVTFKQISESANVDIDAIKILNPQYLKQIIPAGPNKPYTLILPSKNIYAYVQSEKGITEERPRETAEVGEKRKDQKKQESKKTESTPTSNKSTNSDAKQYTYTSVEETVIHTVQSGETLKSIANKYNTNTSRIKKDNNLTSNVVSRGQELKIVTYKKELSDAPVASKTNNTPKPKVEQKKETKTTTVKSNYTNDAPTKNVAKQTTKKKSKKKRQYNTPNNQGQQKNVAQPKTQYGTKKAKSTRSTKQTTVTAKNSKTNSYKSNKKNNKQQNKVTTSKSTKKNSKSKAVTTNKSTKKNSKSKAVTTNKSTKQSSKSKAVTTNKSTKKSKNQKATTNKSTKKSTYNKKATTNKSSKKATTTKKANTNKSTNKTTNKKATTKKSTKKSTPKKSTKKKK